LNGCCSDTVLLEVKAYFYAQVKKKFQDYTCNKIDFMHQIIKAFYRNYLWI
jgi:hypothetical protein